MLPDWTSCPPTALRFPVPTGSRFVSFFLLGQVGSTYVLGLTEMHEGEEEVALKTAMTK